MKHINIISKDGKKIAAFVAENGDTISRADGKIINLTTGEVVLNTATSNARCGMVNGDVIVFRNLEVATICEQLNNGKANTIYASVMSGKNHLAEMSYEII